MARLTYYFWGKCEEKDGKPVLKLEDKRYFRILRKTKMPKS